ncbi:hypothetical protein GCM10009555_032230 [Acrocarpospora macrocephala]|uniref:Glycosyltransferase 2-like domain-containing protein n=1 Tax=Acrocarpospora macrocephala TaxID=150177 RepID=A0A5M3WT70_9ACTN|nr:glycosyltransferase family 2 protein [Acrocarpospora macrocephala]GES12555.1 hypothetical protein Amac_061520 [Acrocarpospora macrocephala]
MVDMLMPSWPRTPYGGENIPEGWRPRQSVTIFTCFYREPIQAFERSAQGQQRLSYPCDLLELVWVVSSEQEQDVKHAESMIRRYNQDGRLNWHLKVLPSVSPKGHALNQVFDLSEAEVIGILDADVVPGPDQLREAVFALEVEGYDLVQAAEVSAGGAGLFSQIRALEDSTWCSSQRGLNRWLGVHVVEGSSVYGRRTTWNSARPFLDTGAEESYEWGLRFIEQGFKLGFVRTASRESPGTNVRLAIMQRSRWSRGELQRLISNRNRLSGRARRLAWMALVSIATRLLIPILLVLSPFALSATVLLSVLLLAELTRLLCTASDPLVRAHSSLRAWLLLIPWEVLASASLFKAIADLAKGNNIWYSVRES